MGWPINPYSLVLLLSFVVAVGTAVVAWRTRPSPGAVPLTALMVSVAGWLGAHVLEIESSSFAMKLFWSDVQWLCAAVIPTFCLVFALEYTGRERWLSRRRLGLLAIEPLVMIGLLLGNDATGLLWGTPDEETVPLGVEWAPPATVASADLGLAAYVHLGYATLCLALVSALVLEVVVHNERLYRWQGLAVLVAIAVPWVSAVLSVSSIETIGTTPIGFTITGLAITFGLYRYRLLELTPIARNEVVANLEDGVLVVDADHRIVDCNPVARRLFDADRDSLIGVPVADLLPAEVDVDSLLSDGGPAADATDPTDVDTAPDDAVSPGTPSESPGDGQFSLGSGSGRRHYALSTSPIDDGRGRPAGWTIVVHEITGRVRRERDLERANRKLDEFATVVSHDLRNPLSVSQGYLDLLESEYDPAHVRKVADAHDRMEELIEEVLTLARQGQGALEPEPVELEAVARAAWKTVETPNATLTVSADRRLRADRTQLRQLLENLFRNSVEHGSTGSRPQADDSVEHGSTSSQRGSRADDTGRRSASSEPLVADAPENAVTEAAAELRLTVGPLENGFYVEDTGSGFESDPEQVFEPGYTTAEEGTGLGLSIVADVVDRHGWSITATDGDGARFEITDVEVLD